MSILQGFSYPLSLYGGSLVLENKFSKLVRNAILSGLYTTIEERVMRPEYGLDPQEFQSVSNIVDILATLRGAIDVALEDYADVSFDLRGSVSEDGRIDVVVVYQCPDEAPNRIEVTL